MNFRKARDQDLNDFLDAADDNDDDTIDEATVSPELERHAAAIVAVTPNFTREQALHFLMFSPHGRRIAEHLSGISKKGPTTMNRADELRDIAKQYGVVAIAKHIIDDGSAHGITEAEFTKLIDDAAQKTRLPGERPGSAFSRYFSAPEQVELRRAHALTKNSPAPMPVEPVQPTAATVSDADSAKAYAKLQDLAAAARAAAPQLSEAQAFAKVFTDPANASLANAAHRRPQPTTSYAF